MYLTVSEGAISLVLLREEDSQQQPIYYTSHILKGAELRYSKLEKLTYALVLTARKLHPYFLAHPIIILINSQLSKVLTKLDFSG